MKMLSTGSPICSIENCGNHVKARKLCDKHLQRLYRTGSAIKKEHKRCAVDGCSELTHFRNQYCKFHRNRFRQTGDPLTPMKIKIGCKMDGCDGYHTARGMCRDHWRVWYKRALLCRKIGNILSSYCNSVVNEIE
jgi:hypothetical protein